MIIVKKSQISVEYMFIIGFVAVITIPLILIYSDFTQESGDEINSVQIRQVSRSIVDAAESVYYLGEPSQTSIKVNIPDNVVLVNLSCVTIAASRAHLFVLIPKDH